MEKQVDCTAYNFSSYCHKKRWMSYWHQLDEVYKIDPKNILIVGTGDGIVQRILSKSIDVKILDIAEDLYPDILGSVTDLSRLTNERFDCILCSQVLEHIPFGQFEKCLKELSICTRQYCVISLPQFRWALGIDFTLNRTLGFQFVFPRKNVTYSFDGQHYWNIGVKGCSRNDIEKLIQKYFYIEHSFDVKEITFHRFYVLKKK